MRARYHVHAPLQRFQLRRGEERRNDSLRSNDSGGPGGGSAAGAPRWDFHGSLGTGTVKAEPSLAGAAVPGVPGGLGTAEREDSPAAAGSSPQGSDYLSSYPLTMGFEQEVDVSGGAVRMIRQSNPETPGTSRKGSGAADAPRRNLAGAVNDAASEAGGGGGSAQVAERAAERAAEAIVLDDSDDEEMEVEQITIDGEDYFLNEKSGDIYHPETQEIVGKSEDGEHTLF